MATDFSALPHEELVAMAEPSTGIPAAFVALAMDRLATAVCNTADAVHAAVGNLDWEGTDADAFRTWAGDLVVSTRNFVTYVQANAKPLHDVANGMQSSTPPPVPPPGSPDAVVTQEHNEAIRLMESRGSTYTTATQTMNAATPPAFPSPPNPYHVDAHVSEDNPALVNGPGPTSVTRHGTGPSQTVHLGPSQTSPNSANTAFPGPSVSPNAAPSTQSAPESSNLLSNGPLTGPTATSPGTNQGWASNWPTTSPPTAASPQPGWGVPGGYPGTGGGPVSSPSELPPNTRGIYGGEPAMDPVTTPRSPGGAGLTAGEETPAAAAGAEQARASDSRTTGYGAPYGGAGGGGKSRSNRKRADYAKEDEDSWAVEASSIVPPVIE